MMNNLLAAFHTPPHPASASLGDPLPQGERRNGEAAAGFLFSPAGRRWRAAPDEGAGRCAVSRPAANIGGLL